MQQSPIVPINPDGSNRTTPVVSRPKQEGRRTILPTLAILIAAPLTALLLTMFVFQSYEVDGPSMEHTLQHQDRLIVWKLPKTFASLTNGHYVPGRGDIVIFVKHGVSEIGGGDKQLIKRVVALPGERVTVRDGKVTVYNKEKPNGFNPDLGEYTSSDISSETGGNIDLSVKDNEIFVLGDNRDNSLDSRAFGTVNSDDVVGKLAVRIFPLNKFESFL